MKQLLNLLSVCAVVLSITCAFAFNSSPKFATTWGVLGTDGTHTYYVVTTLVGKTENTQYICDETDDEDDFCKVSSDAAVTGPNNDLLPIAGATPVQVETVYIPQ